MLLAATIATLYPFKQPMKLQDLSLLLNDISSAYDHYKYLEMT